MCRIASRAFEMVDSWFDIFTGLEECFAAKLLEGDSCMRHFHVKLM